MRTQRKRLADEADRLFSLYIRARDRWCRACGSPELGQCAHVFSRSYRAIRWNELNAVRLCKADHLRFTMRPLEWEDFIRGEIGDEAYFELRRLALEGARPDLQAIVGWLKDELRSAA